MASTPRPIVPGGMYHVSVCGTGPCVIFHDHEDHQHFNFTLAKTVERYGWLLLLWTHMTTHAHLLVWTPQPNLDVGMQRTKSCYALQYNRKYERRGALFDGRYGCRFIQTEKQFFRTVAYIANNPRKAGLCKRGEDWFWGSYGATLRQTRTWPANGADELVRRCGGLEALKRLVDFGYEADAA